ncbi:LamG-like jellyroll fold domain-containing protein [Flavobacterium buctense]|uniref:LamG-like jellyroll fold domain-containing protein n=1 Tax=Flavobacterium buctense TaxID=1648146 RepID=A0ABU9E1K0_9FLAO|nr:LamG-like jellyroll fold domain-containing protein [Flavobacterium buctense]
MKTNRLFYSLVVASGLALVASCSSDDSSSLPPIGGYNSADEVAATSLKAYWPLNGNGKESISNTSPSNTVATTYVNGIKGQAANFDTGFMAYPAITALNTTSGSASISAWIKISNTKLVAGGVSNISPIFSLTRTGEAFGNLNLLGETHGLTTSDSIQMKGIFRIKKPDGTDFGGDAVNMIKQESWMDATHTWAPNKIGGQWAHVVYIYDGPTATNKIYVNGVKISNSAWEVRNGGDPFMLNHFTPTRPVIGALETVANGTNTDAWNAALKGQVDELRLFDKALTPAEIGALYELELAGR